MTEPIGVSSIESERVVAVRVADPGKRGGPVRAFVAMALFEFRMAARSRWTAASAALFAGAAIAISYFGLFGAGYLEFQGFERTAVSLLSLVLYLAPLLGLVLGLGSFSHRDTLDLLFAQPAGRRSIIAGKLFGLTVTVVAASAVGLGAAGLFIASSAGASGIGGYLALVGVSIALGAVFVGIAAICSLGFHDRLQASGAAVAVWVWFVFLYELVLLGILLLVPDTSVRPLLLATIVCSPVMISRVLVLLAVGAHPLLGPSGALLVRTFGEPGAVILLVTALAAWVLLTWACVHVVARMKES
jgi:Cu-processing system permease protein